MKRVLITVDGYVQKVGFREFVLKETFGRGITGYVKNLDNGKVEIIAEGSEDELSALIKRVNITRYPISVMECNVSWDNAVGEFRKFEIFRGDLQEEIFERIDYAGTILHENLDVSKETLGVSKENLSVSKEILGISKENLSVSKENLSVSKENLSVSKENLSVSKENLSVSKEILDVSKETLTNTGTNVNLQKNTLDMQEQMLDLGKETKDEIVGLRKDTGRYLDEEFKEIKKELVSIKDALARAGINV